MITFADQEYFFLLILVPLLVFFSRSVGGRIRFSGLDILKKTGGATRFHPRMILLFLRILCFILFVCALARPEAGKTLMEVSSEGVDIILVIDTSGSMKALDFKLKGKPVNRLKIVKKVVSEFVDKRPADRIGLVVFGNDAYIQCPLTLDHGIVLDFMKKIEIGMAGNATAIGSAIGTSVKRMKDLKSKSKIVILLTDGENTAGRMPPVKAAEVAESYGVKIYTIGVGTRGKAPMLQESIFGKHYVYVDVNIDEDTLKKIADITDGKYFRATDTDELEKIYDEIDKLEKTEVKVKQYTEYYELFHWFLIPAILILLLEIFLGNTRLRKIP